MPQPREPWKPYWRKLADAPKKRGIMRYEDEIKLILAIIAGTSVVFGYFWQVSQNRKARSLTYIERYNKDPILSAKKNLTVFWIDEKTLCRMNRAAPASEKSKIAIEEINARNLHSDMYLIYDFYREVAACGESRNCDPDVLCDFFIRDILRFNSTYYDYLTRWEDKWKEAIRVPIDEFRARECTAQARSMVELDKKIAARTPFDCGGSD